MLTNKIIKWIKSPGEAHNKHKRKRKKKVMEFTKWENINEIVSLTNSRENVIVLQIQNSFLDSDESRETLILIKQFPEI